MGPVWRNKRQLVRLRDEDRIYVTLETGKSICAKVLDMSAC